MEYVVDGEKIIIDDVDVNDDTLVLDKEDVDETQDLSPILEDTQKIEVIDND